MHNIAIIVFAEVKSTKAICKNSLVRQASHREFILFIKTKISQNMGQQHDQRPAFSEATSPHVNTLMLVFPTYQCYVIRFLGKHLYQNLL